MTKNDRASTHWTTIGLALVAAVLLAACGTSGSSAGPTTSTAVSASGSSSGAASSGAAGGGEVTLVTHDSFVIDDAMLADFEASSGLKVTVLAQGDAGAMVNQLLLTTGNPLVVPLKTGREAANDYNTLATRAGAPNRA